MLIENPGLKIKRLRLENGWSKYALAAKLDAACTSGCVLKWERGESVPSWYYAVRLADVFGMSVDELWRGQAPQKCTHINAETTTGRRIKAHRSLLNMTQTQLGEMTGVHYITVLGWEADSSQPTLENIDRLCSALNVSMDELAGRGS